MILALRRLGLTPAEAGRLAERCFAGGATDPALTATLAAAAADHRPAARGAGAPRARARRPRADDRGGRSRRRPPRSRSASCSSATATRRAARSPRRCSAISATRTSRRRRPARAEVGPPARGAGAGRDRHRLAGGSREAGHELLDRRFDYVITLSNCAREACPTLPGPHGSLHWHLEDPSTVEGSEEQRLEAFRATRTELTVRLRPFIEIARRAAGRLPAVSLAPEKGA